MNKNEFLNDPGFAEAEAAANTSRKPRLLVSYKDTDLIKLIARAQKTAIANGMEEEWPEIYADLTAGDTDHFAQALPKYFELDFD